MNVHILVTVLDAKAIELSRLVFKTIRVGFPNARILIYGNEIDDTAQFAHIAHGRGAEFKQIRHVAHGVWIEQLLLQENSPFWICDTDIIFYEPIQANKGWSLFAGRYEPEFMEEWTQSRHVARLHPSLMWFDPVALRSRMRSWPGKHPMFNTVESNLVQWNWVPRDGELLFYDTCAGLHHAFGGNRFSDAENAKYAHLHCGTYAKFAMPELAQTHQLVLSDLNIGRNLLENQEKWYQERVDKAAGKL